MEIITAEEFKKSYDQSYQVFFDTCVERLLSDINKKIKEVMKKNEENIGKPQDDIHMIMNDMYKDDMVSEVASILENNGYKVDIQMYNSEKLLHITV